MATVTRLFCARCNPNNVYPKDRRTPRPGPLATILPFPSLNQRTQADRRKMHNRRVMAHFPPKEPNRRELKGRRPFDGYAWFEGCIERAIQEGWLVEDSDELPAHASVGYVLCPDCCCGPWRPDLSTPPRFQVRPTV